MKFPVNWGSSERLAVQPRLKRTAQIIGVLLLAGALQGCSLIKIAYNQATELAYWQLDAYLAFNAEQSTKVREELNRTLAWHRQTQLPAYIASLQEWQAWLPGELDEAQACEIVNDVRAKLLAISDRGESAAAALVGTLAPEQLKTMRRKFSSLNQEYRSDFLDDTPSALLEKRFKKAVSRAEMLYGSLEEKQLTLLRSRLAQSMFDAQVSLAEHQRRQRDALSTLAPLIAVRANADQAAPALRAYFERSINSPNPAYRVYQDQLLRDGCKTFSALHNSTNAAQRAKALQTLIGYEQDFKLLAAQR